MICPECGGGVSYDAERGEYVCNNCGLVVEDCAIDYGPEYRIFEKTDWDKVRAGPPDSSLTTVIGLEGKDAYGKKLSSKKRGEIYRIAKWQRRNKLERPTRRRKEFQKLVTKYCAKLGMQRDIPEIVMGIYSKLRENDAITGYNNEDVAVAMIYIACRLKREAIPLKVISSHLNRDGDKIAKLYTKICKLAQIEMPIMSAREYMYSFASKLGMDANIVGMGEMILSEIEKRWLSNGKSPTGVAGAVLYIASHINGKKVTQKELSRVSGVTEVTIRNIYREIVTGMRDFIQDLYQNATKL